MPELTDMTLALPTYNDEPSVLRLVLDAATSAPVKSPVIVVDMSTDARVRNACEEFGDRISYAPYPESPGVSASRNRCVELSDTRYVTLLDSDVLPSSGWLDPLARTLREPDVAVAGSRILPQWQTRPPRLFKSVAAAPLLSIFDLGEETIDVVRVIGGSYGLDRELVSDPPFDPALGRKPGDPLGLRRMCCAKRHVRRGSVSHMSPTQWFTT